MNEIALTEGHVRESVAVARSHGEKFFEQIVWQVENEAWRVLGYNSWDEMREGEYGDMGVVAPRADRPELVSRMRAKGLTQAEIAGTLGVSVGTINAAVKFNSENEDGPQTVTNSRGQERPATYTRTETTTVSESVEADPETGEVLDDETQYTRPAPQAPRAEAITTQFTSAIADLNRAMARIRRISDDKNFARNKEQVASMHASDLYRTISELETLAELIS